MAYLTLYRKYRSQVFADLVGQEHIIRTLTNAIENDRLTHAYLFSGPRGTGKTSTARILAKSLNCRTGKTITPCNICDVCKGITDGSSMDVIEIDAASNRGIDEMRQIREKVVYAPVEGKYKVYIIDEVHMLTEPAFNALLKTLEEPPSHTIFVLATTDPQKVPATILSRCQRLDFGRIPNHQIAAHLQYIAGKEQIKMEEKAASMIAVHADGGLRDAISLMDQIIAFSGNTITSDDVITIIGSYSSEFLFALAEKTADMDIQSLLEELDRIVNQGRNIVQIVRDLIDFYRSMMFVKLGSLKSVQLSKEAIASLQLLAARYTMLRIKTVITTLAKAELDMRWHPNARLLLEIAFMDLTTLSEPEPALPQPPVSPAARVTALSPVVAPALQPASPRPVPPVAAPIPAVTQPPQRPDTSPATSADPAPLRAQPPAPAPPQPLAEPLPPPGTLSLPSVKHHWSDIINKLKSMKKIKIFSFMQECEPYKVEDGKVFLSFKEKYQFHRDQLAMKENSDVVLDVFRGVFGPDVSLEYVIGKGMSVAAVQAEEKQQQTDEISNLVSLFDGHVL